MEEQNQGQNQDSEEILCLYLRLFFEAWKRAYKLGWIYHAMVERVGKEVTLAFFDSAAEKRYPLVPEATRAWAGTPFYLTVINRGFSDWMFAKTPDAERFVKNVLSNRPKLIDTPEKWRGVQRECAQELSGRGWEALDSFGGKVKNLKAEALVYASRGRKTGRGASEKTWAK